MDKSNQSVSKHEQQQKLASSQGRVEPESVTKQPNNTNDLPENSGSPMIIDSTALQANPQASNELPMPIADSSEKTAGNSGRIQRPAPAQQERLDPTRYGDWEKNGRCIDF